MSTTFTTHPVLLKALLDGLKDGSIQLPDFQRGWVWDDDRIKGVLASISRSFPIGAVMMLQTGGETRFKTRPVQGVDEKDVMQPSQLILDGQQSLTSLFQAILLETGVYGTLEEIAAAEKINPSYVSRLLRTTLLAPEIVEAILDGRQPADMTLALLMQPFGGLWAEQSPGFQGL